jgi:hypothetical protein
MDGPKRAYPPIKEVKQKYMEYQRLEWHLFAESIGIDPFDSRAEYPVIKWREEKMRMWGERRAEALAARMFEHGYKWHEDMLDTLENFPATAERLHFLIRTKVNDIMRDIPEGLDPKDKRKRLPKVTAHELRQLSSALRDVTESRMKALSAGEWSAEKAMLASASMMEEAKKQNDAFKLEIMGVGEMPLEEMKKYLTSFYDNPPKEDDK